MAETIGAVAVKVVGNTSHLTRSLGTAGKEVKSFAGRVTSLGSRMSTLGASMSTRFSIPLIAALGSATAAYGGFEKGLVESLSIFTGVNSEIRQEMQDTALELSKHAKAGPTELAKAYFFLGSAGLDAAQSMKALPAVEQFATAGAFDLSEATDLLTDAQSALGLTVKDATQNYRNMVHVSDTLVKANTLANASVQQFSESLTHEAAAAMRNYGIELADGIAVLAAYADQGVKGQLAGTMFGRAIRLLTNEAVENADAFKAAGVASFDSQGNMRSMVDIVRDLSRKMETLSTREKVVALSTLGFKARIQQAILPLIGMTDKIERYRKELRDAGGTTERVAKIQLAAFANQMKMVWNRIQVTAIKVGSTIAPVVLKLAKGIGTLVEAFGKLPPWMLKVMTVSALVVAAIGPLLLIAGGLVTAFGMLLKFAPVALTAIKTAAVGAGTALAPVLVVVLKIAVAVAAVKVAWMAVKTATALALGEGETAQERYLDGMSKMNEKTREFAEVTKTSFGFAKIHAKFLALQAHAVLSGAVDNILRSFIQVFRFNIPELFFWLLDNWRSLGKALLESFGNVVWGIGKLFMDLGASLVDFLKDPFGGFNLDRVRETLSTVADEVKANFSEVPAPELTKMEYRNLLDEVVNLEKQKQKAISDLTNRNIFGDPEVASSVEEAGKKFGRGVAGGIERADRKLSGALERGTAEAFSAEQGGQRIAVRTERNTREIAQNSKQQNKHLSKLLEVIKGGETGGEVVDIPA